MHVTLINCEVGDHGYVDNISKSVEAKRGNSTCKLKDEKEKAKKIGKSCLFAVVEHTLL